MKVAAKLLEFHDLIVAGDRINAANKTRAKKDPPFVAELRLIVENTEKDLQLDAEKAPKSLAKKIKYFGPADSQTTINLAMLPRPTSHVRSVHRTAITHISYSSTTTKIRKR